MSQPLFSVVIPTYNRLAFLRQAVESVREQRLGSWELLIVDDGSEDQTAEYCRASEDPRVRLVALRHSGIVGQIRNEGASRAKGRYLAFLDSDDLWQPDKLDRQLEACETIGAKWSYTGYQVVDEAGAFFETHVPPGEAGAPADLLIGLLSSKIAAVMSSLVVSREAFNRVDGFSTHPRIREDHDLVVRLVEAGEPRVEVPKVLVTIRDHERRSNSGEPDPFSRSAVAVEQFLERSRRPDAKACARKVLAHHLIASAGVNLRRGRHLAAGEKLRRAWNPGWRTPGFWLLWSRYLVGRRQLRDGSSTC